MDFILHFLTKPLMYFGDWTLDQKIQTLILAILILTLGWAMLVEIPKMRKVLRILSYDIGRHSQQGRRQNETEFHTQKFTHMHVTFSNSCRRPIKVIGIEVFGYSGLQSKDAYNWSPEEELEEGDYRTALISFDDWLEDKDLKQITFTDSMEKRYFFYYYRGDSRNWWIIQTLLFRDWIVSFFSSSHPDTSTSQQL